MVTSKEIHQNAMDHGWWDKVRSIDSILCLMHSEVSEALEDYREDKMDLYYEEDKPCGYPIELADIKIRTDDLLEAWNNKKDFSADESIPDNLCVIHSMISDCFKDPFLIPEISKKINYMLCCLAEDEGKDLDELVKIKHEYNKTRPYRHGGKKV